ncbi:MAG: hypothetical protein NC314_11765 [Roseburia sp.]|nr:hypothetical protein [Ruminococcus sp.]MCM1154740.1 hypothetical protein [Roseburia sp.]MCM1243508.1 hypothetical protein [Roseburia sp.]
MDTFMDKLVQKRNAQGLINANAAADAAKMEMLQQQVTEYDALLQEMRKVNLKTVENAEQMQKVIQASLQKIEAYEMKQEDSLQKEELLADMKKQMEEAFKNSDDFMHKECVKVYRNVQASMTEEFSKQTSALSSGQQDGAQKQKAMLPLSLLTFLLVIADILIHLFNITLHL